MAFKIFPKYASRHVSLRKTGVLFINTSLADEYTNGAESAVVLYDDDTSRVGIKFGAGEHARRIRKERGGVSMDLSSMLRFYGHAIKETINLTVELIDGMMVFQLPMADD